KHRLRVRSLQHDVNIQKTGHRPQPLEQSWARSVTGVQAGNLSRPGRIMSTSAAAPPTSSALREGWTPFYDCHSMVDMRQQFGDNCRILTYLHKSQTIATTPLPKHR